MKKEYRFIFFHALMQVIPLGGDNWKAGQGQVQVRSLNPDLYVSSEGLVVPPNWPQK